MINVFCPLTSQSPLTFVLLFFSFLPTRASSWRASSWGSLLWALDLPQSLDYLPFYEYHFLLFLYCLHLLVFLSYLQSLLSLFESDSFWKNVLMSCSHLLPCLPKESLSYVCLSIPGKHSSCMRLLSTDRSLFWFFCFGTHSAHCCQQISCVFGPWKGIINTTTTD